MKNLCFLVFVAMFLFPNVSKAQNSDSLEKEKKEIIELHNRWEQEVLINQNLDIVKEFYPKNGLFNEITNNQIKERTVGDLKEELLTNFEYSEIIDVKSSQGLDINISKNQQTATINTTIEFVMKERSFFNKYICILKKEDGRWVRTLEEYEMAGDGASVEIDKSILDEYNGTYKVEKMGLEFTVGNDGKNIVISNVGGGEFKFIPKTESLFIMENSTSTIVFERDKNGKVCHYTLVDNNFAGVVKKVNESPTLESTAWRKFESSRSYTIGGDPFSSSEEDAGFVKSIGNEPQGISSMWTSVEHEAYLGKRVKLSAALKTEDVGKMAGLMMRINGEKGKILSLDNMSDRALKATNDWSTYDIVLDVPENSTGLFVGVALEGKGQVWAKDMTISEVDKSVAVTDNYDRWVDEIRNGNYEKAIPLLTNSIEKKGSRLDGYNSLYYYIALMETGQKGEANKYITDYAKAQQSEEWITQLACYLCGDLSEKKLLKASVHENETTEKENKCEAYYFMGMQDKFNNNIDRAKECFKKCLATNQTGFIEYNLAQQELESL